MPVSGTRTTSTERAAALDALRGLAVFGILLANMQHFSGWFFLSAEQRAALPTAQADAAAHFLINWFIDGKFYSLFSLLFGIGFAVLLVRADRAGRDFHAFFGRRLRILLAIGLVHAFGVWYGDILTLYALLGFALLAFRTRSDATLLRWALVLLALPVVQYAVMLVLFGGAAPDPAAEAARATFMSDVVRTMATGTWPEVARLNVGGVLLGRYPDLLFTGRPFKVLATFLLGLWIGRRGIWSHPGDHVALLRRVAAAGLAVGLPLNLGLALLMRSDAYYALQPAGLLQAVVYGVGVPALALGYAAAFALLWQAARAQRVLAGLVPVGRMALSCYLMHSVIGAVLFYGWGLGRFGTVGIAPGLAVAAGIFVLQCIGCALWLRHFRHGPAEWLWRSLTLRTRQPLRLAAEPTAATGIAR